MPTRILSRLTEIEDLRAVWPNEATDFTPWLAEDENIELLADAIGIEISVEDTEVSIGSFNADIYATEADTGKRIIIENQLEQTDHDHLGKIITYAAGKDANYVVWIAKHARPEHKAAIEWLNSRTDSDVGFFLCELKLYQIGSSDIAPQFVAVEAPNDWSKAAKARLAAGGSSAATSKMRYDYWTAFNDYAFQDSDFAGTFTQSKPSEDHWHNIYKFPGKGAELNIKLIKKRSTVAVEFYISDNKSLYDNLAIHTDEINSIIGEEPVWQRLNDKKASRIQLEKEFPIDDENNWRTEFTWAMEVAGKFKEAIEKFI